MAKKLRYFKILMDDESLLYFPGVFLTGKVVLELDEDTPILGEFAAPPLNPHSPKQCDDSKANHFSP